MKKHTEKQPIDDLFAKKLSNISLPPSADGFKRLQARMNQHKPEARMVVWRNPVVQRYTTAAACLVVFCSLGWLYWPSETKTTPGKAQVAVNHNVPLRSEKHVEKQSGSFTNTPTADTKIRTPFNPAIEQDQLANAGEVSAVVKNKSRLQAYTQPVNERDAISQPEGAIRSEAVLTQTKSTNSKVSSAAVSANDVTPVNQSTPELIVVTDNNTAAKASPPAERVLVVTIEEPAALVAARQVAKAAVNEKTPIAVTDKPEKEPKESGLWKQVKRYRQDELFARSDNAKNDDRGLLSRAYDGLKHSLDKDKSAKQ